MTTRLLGLATVLVTALLLQTVLVPAVVPGAVRPDFVTLSVIAYAVVDGPGIGARYGFVAGLVVDLLSAGGPPVGVFAVVLLLVGYGVGSLRPYLASVGLAGEVAVVAAASSLAVGLFGLLAALLDVAAANFVAVLRAAFVTGVLNGLLAPFALRAVAALSRRVDAAG